VIGYTLKRLGLAVLVALAVSMIAFLLLRLSGDPATAIAGEGATQVDIDLIRQTYGFDRPLPVQYLAWLGQLVRGDLGDSIYFKTATGPLILGKLKTTLLLGMLALAFALLVSIPLGVLAAIYRNSWVDRLCLATAVVGQALPNFFFALLLIRAGMIEVLEADYIRTARAKGLPATQVIFKHALRNAVVPVVALSAVQLGYLLGGSVVIETIFALDGLGYLAYQSITFKDFPVMQVIVLLLSVIYVLLTLAADIANAWLDPRIRVA